MQHMWAPWRMAYIGGVKSSTCVLCDKLKEDDDHRNFILHRGRRCFVILNLYPYNNGHLMVSPLRHVGHLYQLDHEEIHESGSLLGHCEKIIHDLLHPEGFNIGLNLGLPAGAGVENHVHWHMVPRWNGDTNFMTVLGQTRVIPEALAASYDRLLPCFKALDL